MEYKIVPTLFSYNVEQFKKRYDIASKITDTFQIDIMDGKFVPNESVNLFDLDFVKDLEGDFEVDLMCEEPEKYFEQCEKIKAKIVFFHYEVVEDALKFFRKYQDQYDFEIGLSVNPQTPFEDIKDILDEFRTVLFMGVVPGAEQQAFIEETYEKVRKCREMYPDINIEIDGGVKDVQVEELTKAGANLFCVGSFIGAAQDPAKNYKLLQDALDRGKDYLQNN